MPISHQFNLDFLHQVDGHVNLDQWHAQSSKWLGLAKQYRFESFRIPQMVQFKDIETVAKDIACAGLNPILNLQLNSKNLAQLNKQGELRTLNLEFSVEAEPSPLEFKQALTMPCQFNLVPNRNWQDVGPLIAAARPRATLQFPFLPESHYLDADEIFCFLENLKRSGTSAPPHSSYDLKSPFTPASFEVILDAKPKIIYASHTANFDLSVIFPVFNRKLEILTALNGLHDQTFSKPVNFQVLIVDDGSEEELEPVLANWCAEFKPSFQLEFIKCTRSFARKFGDRFFRAGIARNLGASHAKAGNLAFLDSDILVSPTFVQECVDLLREAAVVQWPRRHLPDQQAVSWRTAIEHSQNDDAYWQGFFAHKQWPTKDRWKYISTYALSLSAELFWKVGGFRPCFHSYGLEDTLLGYMIDHVDSRPWKIATTPIVHLRGLPNRSEHRYSYDLKCAQMVESAQKFYHITQDRRAYIMFRNLMGKSRWARTFGRKFFSSEKKIPLARFTERALNLISI